MGTQTSVNNSSNSFHHLLCAEPWPECCGGDKSTQDTAFPTGNLLERGKLGGGWEEMTNTHKMLSQGYTDEHSLQSAEWREPTLEEVSKFQILKFLRWDLSLETWVELQQEMDKGISMQQKQT